MHTTPRRARWSIAAIFFINGAVFGSWAPNVPVVRDRLGLTDGQLSIALLGMALGAVIAMPIAGYLCSRFGSAGPSRWSALGMVVFLPFLAYAPSLPLLVLGTLAVGFSNGICDVAMNTHAVEVERQYGRAIMSGLHAIWSVAGFLSSSLAGILLAHVTTGEHFLGVSAVLLVATLVAMTGLLPGESDRGEAGSHFALPDGKVIVIGGLTLICFLLEGAMLDWNAVFMRTTYAPGPTLTAAGYAAFAGGMAIGRFSGDYVRTHASAVHIVRIGGLVAGVGLIGATYAGDVYLTIAAFAVAGLGVANLVPLFLTAAGRASSASSGKGVAAAATCGYCGFLAGPPVIGFLSEHTGLAPAFVMLAVGTLLIAIMAEAVRPADQLPGQ